VETSTVVLITLVAYKVILIGVGLWASRRNRTTTDFFLGGRDLGPVVAGLSYAASTSSAWVILGFSGFVYSIGLSALWMVPGIWAGYVVVWLYFGERLRTESRVHGQITLTDFLLQDSSAASEDSAGARKLAAAIAAVLILVCFVFYIAAQFDAAGKALAEHFAMSASQAVVLGAAIVLVYALLGGFWAVSVTDTLQALIMMLVALGVPVVALVAAGGPQEVWRLLALQMPASYLSFNGGHAGLVWLGFVTGLIGMSLGTLGQPHLLSRLMAVRGTQERRMGFGIAISWGVLVYIGMAILGLSGRVLLPDLANAETLFAGAVAHDMGVNQRFPQRQLLASRVVMFAITLLAVVLTLSLPDSIFNRVLFAWSALGAAFGPIVVWRVRGLRVMAWPALGSMLAGFITTVVFYSLGAAPVTESLLSQAAHLPGDPFERVFPWVPALLVLLVAANKKN